MASAPRLFPGALTSVVTLARARPFPEFSVPARCCSTGSGRLGGAAAAGGGRDALSYGVSFATTRSHQLARLGSGVLSLRHFGLVLFIPLARGCRRIWRGVKWLRRRDSFRARYPPLSPSRAR